MIKSRRMTWAVNAARKPVKRILTEKPEGKRPLRKPRHTWEDNIKSKFREAGCEVVDRFHLTQSRGQWRAIMNMEINFRVT
jgi:hypothetical protein